MVVLAILAQFYPLTVTNVIISTRPADLLFELAFVGHQLCQALSEHLFEMFWGGLLHNLHPVCRAVRGLDGRYICDHLGRWCLDFQGERINLF